MSGTISARGALLELMLLRDGLAASPVVVLGVLGAIGLLSVLVLAGSRAAAVLLVFPALVWPVVNARVEGPTLLPLTWNHGVSAADMITVVALLVAFARLLPARAAAR